MNKYKKFDTLGRDYFTIDDFKALYPERNTFWGILNFKMVLLIGRINGDICKFKIIKLHPKYKIMYPVDAYMSVCPSG
jgi:hypothetical protein